MPEIQFEITTDLAPYTGANIQTNKEAVKAYLTDLTAPYATMIVAEDEIALAKKDLASLRKIVTSIEDQRKAVKKAWMKPYDSYEADCKELVGVVNEAIGNIDGQLKDYDRRKKEEKRERLNALFDENSADVADYISFEDVFDSKWLNASFSEIDAANSIVSQIEDIRDGLDAIRGMESPYEAAMLSEYAKSHNLSKAMAEGKRLEAIQKAEEERKAREAMVAAAKAEEASQTVSEPDDDVPAGCLHVYVPTPSPIRPVVDEEPPREKTYAKTFHFPELTKQQMYALKNCFTANNIKYQVL